MRKKILGFVMLLTLSLINVTSISAQRFGEYNPNPSYLVICSYDDDEGNPAGTTTNPFVANEMITYCEEQGGEPWLFII